MRRLALEAIRIYKRHVSPRKGFSCAYRSHLGRFSCSTLGYRAIRRYGLLKGLAVLRQRTSLCAQTLAVHRNSKLEAQRGSAPCDIPCDGDCLPDVDCRGAGRYLGCCDGCSCEWPDRKDKKNRRRRDHIPPARSRVQRQ